MSIKRCQASCGTRLDQWMFFRKNFDCSSLGIPRRVKLLKIDILNFIVLIIGLVFKIIFVQVRFWMCSPIASVVVFNVSCTKSLSEGVNAELLPTRKFDESSARLPARIYYCRSTNVASARGRSAGV